MQRYRGTLSSALQALVDTYGVPRYREINPGVFAIVLFPFLFGIMFGDVGHGALLLLLALYFIRHERRLARQKLDDMVAMAFGGRYVLLLNGLFSMYVGFLYNEVFSVPMGLFRSTYTTVHDAGGTARAQWDGTVYPFGIDPMWHLATNKMTFFNSFKMKASIVVGVLQMALGILLSLLNHREFKDGRAIWFRFVPELTFFLSIFGAAPHKPCPHPGPHGAQPRLACSLSHGHALQTPLPLHFPVPTAPPATLRAPATTLRDEAATPCTPGCQPDVPQAARSPHPP